MFLQQRPRTDERRVGAQLRRAQLRLAPPGEGVTLDVRADGREDLVAGTHYPAAQNHDAGIVSVNQAYDAGAPDVQAMIAYPDHEGVADGAAPEHRREIKPRRQREVALA